MNFKRFIPAAALASVAILAAPFVANAAPATGATSAAVGLSGGSTYPYPNHISESGVPEFGPWGTGDWHEAGLINWGEPTVRVVYDASVPGSYATAMGYINRWTAQERTAGFPQPGTRDGLREVGYTAHYSGVQVQVYGNNPSIDQGLLNTFAAEGWEYFYA
jgi:hypothetical protein